MSETTGSLMVIHNLEHMPDWTVVRAWPLHFTVVPYFGAGESGAELALAIDTVQSVARQTSPFLVTPGERAIYGTADDSMSVTRLNESDSITNLHMGLLKRLKLAGAVFDDESYTGSRYSPHVSDTGEQRLPMAEFRCDSVSLIKRYPKTAKVRKLVVRRFLFGG